MKLFLKIIKFDYLQRTRSYSFIVTLCISLAIAYTFVPEPNASYSTIRVGDYIGFYNSAWFGYVTAMMTSIFLSLVGFYLINDSIKKDSHTKVGQMIATSSVSNFKYLFSKVMSNFLVLLTIVAIVFLMSIALFFLYNDGYSFEIIQFIKPYFIITIPTMFMVAVLGIVFEIILGKYTTLKNVIFFFLFSSLMVIIPKNEAQYSFDIFGSKIVIHQLENTIKEITNADKNLDLSIGYVLGNVTKAKKFEFTGINFPWVFILSRFAWVLLGSILILIVSPFFHRFNIKRKVTQKKQSKLKEKNNHHNEINLSELVITTTSYGILPLLKTEILLLFRKGRKWLWIINILGMTSLIFLPLELAHQMVLPILWFLQVHRISDITSKEISNRTYLFSFSAYQPIGRILVSKILSGMLLLFIISSPIIIRFILTGNIVNALFISLGVILLVLFSALLGLLSKGKKLFEILFFLITYANINGIVYVDYFGAFKHHPNYMYTFITLITSLSVLVYIIRKKQLKSL